MRRKYRNSARRKAAWNCRCLVGMMANIDKMLGEIQDLNGKGRELRIDLEKAKHCIAIPVSNIILNDAQKLFMED